MQRVSRLRFIILATIACVILFCIAAFSVSLALWSGSDETTAEVSGESGLFYVEYPLYNTREEVVPPALNSGTYYLQVTPANNTNNISDYYAMTENNETEKKLTGVLLHVGDTLAVYNGTTPEDINGNSQQDRSDWLTLDDGKYTIKTEGLYDFYYVFAEDARYFWINRTDYVAPNPSDYEYSFTVKFSDIDEEKTIHYKLDGFTTPCAYIWSENGGTKYYYNANWTTGNNTGDSIGGGNPKAMADAGTTAVKVGEFAETKVIFTNGGWTDQSANLMLGGYADKKDNYVTIGTIPTNDGSTPPTLSGSTTWNEGSAADEKMGEQIVREVNAKITKNDSGQFVYNNYVCVSRKNEDGAADNSIAYLEFSVSDCKINGTTASPYNVVVKSVTLTRRDTDENGVPTDGFITPAPRIYNYDSNEMRLGPDFSHNKPDPDGSEGRYAIFAHGNKHDVSEGLEGEAQDNHMIDHYDDGTYVVLFFGDGYQQYFALDIEIVLEVADATAEDLDFTLTVHASNTNNWQRYEEGYGKPWGLYLGGLINDVWSWDPSRTTEMSGNPAITAADVSTINQNGIMVSYPNIAIDYTITLNLTKGSLVKPYLLDSTGYRRQEGGAEANAATAYFVAKKIIASDGLYDGTVDGRPYYNINSAVTDLGNINIYIPYTGEYTFRLKGKVTPGYTAARSGWYVNLVTGETKKVDDNEEAPSQDDYWYGVAAFNFLVDELYISTADTAAEFTVKFELNGGTGAGDYSDQKVKFGQCATKPTDPTNGTLNFGGWYTNEACTGAAYDFNTIVTGNITLYAKWAANMFTVTFDAGDGSFDEGVQNEVTVAEGTPVSKIQPDPKYAKHIFDGWYDNEGCTGEPYDFDSAVTAPFTLYAKWLDAVTVTFDLGDGTTQKVEIVKGSSVTEWPEIASTGYHHFDGWFTEGGMPIVTATEIFDADTTVYARFTDKVRIVIDASALYNVNSSNTYHIHAWNSDDQTLTGAWTERKQLTHMGGGKFYYDLDQVPSGFIVTLDSNDTMIELGRYQPDSVAGLALGAESTPFTMNVASLTFNSQLYNQIGLVFNDGVIVLDASAWSADDRPNQIYMWKGIGGDITAGWSGDTIKYGEFKKYNVGLSAVYGIILVKNGSGVTGDITPGNTTDGVAYPSLENGNIYIIKEHTLTAKTPVTVTFDSDGGSAVDAQTIWSGEKVIKPTDPTRADYIFNGWYNGATAWNFANEVTDSMTLTAQWLEAVTVTFDGNEGTWSDGKGEQDVTLGKGQTVTAYAAPDNAPDGQVFMHWSETPKGEPFSFGTAITGPKTLYAVWKVRDVNKVYIELDASEWPGYNHANAYTYRISIGGTDSGYEMTGSGTTYTYELDSVDDISSITFIQYQHGTYTEISRYVVSVSGLTFGETYTYKATIANVTIVGTNRMGLWFNDGIIVLDASSLNDPANIHIWNQSNENLFGAWPGRSIDYNKFIDCSSWNMGDVKGIILNKNNGGDNLTGDVLVNQSDDNQLKNGHIYNIGSNQHFAEKVQYTVTFDAYGGSWSDGTDVQTQSIDKGGKAEELAAPDNAPAGKAFGGWYKEGEDTAFNFNTPINSAVKLVAKWVDVYTITFDLNGGEWNTNAPAGNTIITDINGRIPSGSVPTLKQREDYIFNGWKVGNTDTVILQSSLGTTVFSANTTLTAQWTEKPADTVTVTFDAGEGTCATESETITKGTALTTLPNTATKDLHSFDGWFTEDGEEVSATTTFDTDTTIYAHWTAVAYRIVLNVTNWTGTTGYDYHIHAWGGTGVGTVTGGSVADDEKWNNRDKMISMGNNKYYFDLTKTGITTIIFTQDTTGTRTEHSRYLIYVSGINLGDTYNVESSMAKLNATTWANSWGNISDIKLTYSTTNTNPSNNVGDGIDFSSDKTIWVPTTIKRMYFFFKQGGQQWRSENENDTNATSVTVTNGRTYNISVNWKSDNNNNPKLCTISLG
ncbi:MAG: InlB B-repeat-containing protein [Clostridiales bacterium]|nr:InlB B-repeat-containing protein [Clostridiales bacterium]